MFKDTRGKSWFDIFPKLEGQLNYSILYPGAVKAFHRHKYQDDWIFCIFGDIKAVIGDKEFYLTQGDSLVIKKNKWHGFQALGGKEAGMLYYCTRKYDSKYPDEERERWDKFNNWEIENK